MIILGTEKAAKATGGHEIRKLELLGAGREPEDGSLVITIEASLHFIASIA